MGYIMLKWNKYIDFSILRTYDFKLDPTRKYYYKKLSESSEISIYVLDDDVFKMYDVIIDCTMGTLIYDLDVIYQLIKKGYLIKVC